jgi:hypothetical protein
MLGEKEGYLIRVIERKPYIAFEIVPWKGNNVCR